MFFIFFQNIEADALASAANWMFVNLSSKYQRPLAGEVNINLLHNSNLQRKSEYEIREMRRVFYHELIHALAYSEENFPYFINEEGKQYSFCLLQPYRYEDNRIEFFLQHPKIKKIVEDYYNCRDPLLNKGLPISRIDKSHFHQQLSLEDIMRPVSDTFDERISVFLLALLEISGWYVIPEEIYYESKSAGSDVNVQGNDLNNNSNGYGSNFNFKNNVNLQNNNNDRNVNNNKNNQINTSQHYYNNIIYNNYNNPNQFQNKQNNNMNFIENHVDLIYSNTQNNSNYNNPNSNKKIDFIKNNNQINNNINNNLPINNNNNIPTNTQNNINNINSSNSINNNPVNNSNQNKQIPNTTTKNIFDIIKNNYAKKNNSELYKIAEKMLYGRNKGCNFVNLYCHDENGDLFEEYCDPIKEENKQKCNYHNEAISHCRLLEKEAGSKCAYWFPLEGGNCKNIKENRIVESSSTFMKFGPQSKCFDVAFDSKNEDAVCLEAFCDNTENAVYVFLDGLRFKSIYEYDKPKTQFFYSKKFRMKVLFPKSFERFCFLENNAKNPDKGFRR